GALRPPGPLTPLEPAVGLAWAAYQGLSPFSVEPTASLELPADLPPAPPEGGPRRPHWRPLLMGSRPTPEFIMALKMLWSTRELQQLWKEAWRGFAALGDPLAGLLAMLERGQGWQGKGPSLEVWVACEFRCWLQARPHPGLAQDTPLAEAGSWVSRADPRREHPQSCGASGQHLPAAGRRPEPLLAHIHRLHQEGKFRDVSGTLHVVWAPREGLGTPLIVPPRAGLHMGSMRQRRARWGASQCPPEVSSLSLHLGGAAIMLGTNLKLQPELDVEKMCTPLLLQDEVSLVERYMASFLDVQRRLLALMDSWCQLGFDRIVSR
ncbi:hypothetical protein MC885_004531, partial [Smutsia gigantea]